MASKIPIRGLLRPASSPATPLPAGVVLPPARSHYPHHRLLSTTPLACAADKTPLFNWQRTQKQRKNFRPKTPPGGDKKGKAPAPGDRKAFRKRITLSNNSALEVRDLPELGPATMAPPTPPPAPLSTPGVEEDKRSEEAEPAGAGAVAGAVEKGEGEEAAVPSLPSYARGVVALPGPLVDQLRALGVFKPTQTWGLFRRPHFLLREETTQLVNRLEAAGRGGAAGMLRLVIDGGPATGKSMLMLQAIAYALLHKWVVIHIPEGQELTNGNTEYSPVSDTNPVQFTQPVYTSRLLERILDANEPVLRGMTMSREFKTDLIHLPAGSTLTELASSAREAETAWPVFVRLWHELTAAPGRPPVLFCLDGLAHVMRMSAYRDPTFRPVHAHELALGRLFVSALSRTNVYAAPTALVNGGAILATAGGNNSPHVPALELALRQGAARFAAEASGREEAEIEIPEPDPYERHYDPRVTEALREVRVMRVGGVSRDEARSVLEYWAASGLLRTAVTDRIVAEKWSLAGGGVLGEMERVSLLSMRM